MSQKILVLGGTGQVGRQLTDQLLKRPDGSNDVALGGIGTHEGLFVLNSPVKDGLRRALTATLAEGPNVFREGVRTCSEHITGVTDVRDTLIRHLRDGGIVVDSTALAQEVLGVYAGFADRSADETHGGLVTVNKNPLVICGPEIFAALAEMRGKFGFSGTVMAGTGAVVDEVLSLRHTTAGIRSIEGCLSGTLGYLCSALEGDHALDFSRILGHAKDRGYTEPDPRVDLSGGDVARKLVILARAAGYNVSLDDVSVEPFIDRKFLGDGLSVQDFMQSLSEDRRVNIAVSQMFDGARRKNKRLRYVAEMMADDPSARPTLTVGLKVLDMNNPLANLQGTGNQVLIYTRDFKNGPRALIGGPGAGPLITAQAVMRDIRRVAMQG